MSAASESSIDELRRTQLADSVLHSGKKSGANLQTLLSYTENVGCQAHHESA